MIVMHSTADIDKKELRKVVRERKRAIPTEEKARLSAQVLQQVETLPQFRNSHTVLMYWSMADEVATHAFVERWYRHKTVLLPCVDGNDLLLRQYTGREQMVAGPQFGIEEPTGPLYTTLEQIDTIVVPGVAFDVHRNRMGRGRGFYDRLLQSTPQAYKIGVAFDIQIFDSIPVQEFDIPMNCVVSQSSIY